MKAAAPWLLLLLAALLCLVQQVAVVPAPMAGPLTWVVRVAVLGCVLVALERAIWPGGRRI